MEGEVKAKYATLEPNINNTDGCAATIYFDEAPTEEDIRFAFSDFTDLFRKSQGGSWPNIGPDVNENGDYAEMFWAAPNALSPFRYQAQTS